MLRHKLDSSLVALLSISPSNVQEMSSLHPIRAMGSLAQYQKLAQTLPKPLLNFFRRFPPGSIPQTPPPTVEQRIAAEAARRAEAVSTSNQDGQFVSSLSESSSQEHPAVLAPQAHWSSTAPESDKKLLASHPLADPGFSPFLPWKNPVTGRWRGARYGLRRQADLCKMARQHGVEALLPWSSKLSWVREQKKEERGLRVKGTGEGQRVKGKHWERTMKARLEVRREAMRRMPELINEWKRRGHGRGWKKWPK